MKIKGIIMLFFIFNLNFVFAEDDGSKPVILDEFKLGRNTYQVAPRDAQVVIPRGNGMSVVEFKITWFEAIEQCKKLKVDKYVGWDVDPEKVDKYTGWFLPDIQQLKAMYKEMKRQNRLGSFEKGMYWSSSPTSAEHSARTLDLDVSDPLDASLETGALKTARSSFARCIRRK